jgi:hypothetical protein
LELFSEIPDQSQTGSKAINMPIEPADFFSSVELYPSKTGKFWKYQKYHLKLKIEDKLGGKIFGEKSGQKTM